MLLGYAIVAVPTGIVTVELSRRRGSAARLCPRCASVDHDPDARFCKLCGGSLGTPPAGRDQTTS